MFRLAFDGGQFSVLPARDPGKTCRTDPLAVVVLVLDPLFPLNKIDYDDDEGDCSLRSYRCFLIQSRASGT